MRQVDIATLSLGATLGQGGQGTVYALLDDPVTALKLYHDPIASQAASNSLDELDRIKAEMTAAGHVVEGWATWPHTKVSDRGTFVGYLMPRVPPTYQLHIGGRVRLAELSYLATTPKPVWGLAALPNAAARLLVLASLCAVVQTLHDWHVVIGDLSFRNVLWTVAPTPAVMLLDCDDMQIEGRPDQRPQLTTVDWNDPFAAPGETPSQDGDRYKLALAIIRVLTQSLTARPGEAVATSLDVSDATRTQIEELAARAAGPRGTRPTADQWRAALTGRKMVPVTQPAPLSRTSSIAKPELLSRPRTRTMLPVKPPGRP